MPRPYICPYCLPERTSYWERCRTNCPHCNGVVNIACPACRCASCTDPAVQAVMAELAVDMDVVCQVEQPGTF